MDVDIVKPNSQLITYAVKVEIARLVNEEKLLVTTVAKRFSVTPATVTRIASTALKAQNKLRQKAGGASEDVVALGPVMPPRPFPDGETPSLRGKKLTPEEKYYLACLVNIRRVPCSHVAAHYDFPATSMMKFALQARQGKPFVKQKTGATSLIDTESDQALRALAALDGDSRPSRAAMTAHITAEMAKTLERRGKTPATTSQDAAPAAQVQESGNSLSPPVAGVGGEDESDSSETHQKSSARSVLRYLKRYGF